LDVLPDAECTVQWADRRRDRVWQRQGRAGPDFYNEIVRRLNKSRPEIKRAGRNRNDAGQNYLIVFIGASRPIETKNIRI
jgi:hypothetical protein